MIKLLITTSAGATDAARVAQYITWDGDYQRCVRVLTFGLLSSDTDKSIPVVSCPLGAGVSFSLDGAELFNGYVFTRQKDTGGSVIDVTCFDRGIYLKRNEAVYKIKKMTAEALAGRVCKDFGIEVGSLAATGAAISRNFVGVNLYKIIQTAYTLASETTGKKYYARFFGAKFSVLERTASPVSVTIEGGKNLMSATTTESVEDMVNQVVIYDSNDNRVAVRKNDENIALYGLLQSYMRKKDGEDAGKEAQRLLEDNGVTQKITVENLGDASFTTGKSVIIREPYTGLSGLFYIDGDTHTWKNGVYVNKLTVNFKSIMDEQQAGSEESKKA